MTRRTGADTKKNLWIILDELPALGKIPSLKTASAEARKYGGCIVAGCRIFINAWESTADMRASIS